MIVIPAKYNSSRAPLKNFRPFYRGLSLLQIASIRAVESNCGVVVVSSENPEAVESELSKLPGYIRSSISIHERPQSLAQDPATIIDVVVDCLSKVAGVLPKELIVILPTSPLNSAEDLVSSREIFRASKADRLLSVSKATKPPFNAWSVQQDKFGMKLHSTFLDNPYRLTQSTGCPDTYFSNGCISIFSVEALMGDRQFDHVQGFEMPQISSMDIDYDFEFELAQLAFPRWAKDLHKFDRLVLDL